MTKKTSVLGVALLSTALLLGGCQKPPQVELDAATAALSDAQTAQAGTYAADALAAAQDALNQAKQEIETQGGKFALFRSYKNATTMLADAKAKAEAAKSAAVAGKEAAKNAAQAAIDAAKTAVTGVTTAWTELEACPRKPKGWAADAQVLKGQIDGLTAGVTGLDSAFGSEDYFGAKSQAENLSSQAAALVTEIGNAKTKIKC